MQFEARPPGGTDKRLRVVVAMSGGVDSSTVAALLVEAGHEVIGVAMKTHALAPKSNRACCTPDDMRDARRVAQHLGIPFYVLAYEDLFAREVVAPFVAAYRAGLTPNPCIACNDRVKFRPLLARAKLLGADRLATGHYARAVAQANGQVALLRGQDANKDQSYFLYRLTQEQLATLWFPLGAMDKPTVRAHARRLGLDLADKQESQDICFVGQAGYAAVVAPGCGAGRATADAAAPAPATAAPVRGGLLVNLAGEPVGRHPGIHHFTVGQRRGIGPGLTRASPVPLFVADICPDSHRVVVAPKEALQSQEVVVVNLTWVRQPPAVGDEVLLQQRHRERPKAATVLALADDRLTLQLCAKVLRGAPGQAAVLYGAAPGVSGPAGVGQEVLGGGTVLRVVAPRPAVAPAPPPLEQGACPA